MASNIGYERRKAVANAWKKEKSLVSGGLGTRDWSKKEQKEILSKGRATGYEGHHMKSVDGHNSRAGDANNIQFLNRKEHLAAHSGDFHNNTNGFYDHKTGEMHSFGRNKPSIEAKKLSDPLSQKQVDKLTKKRAGFFKSAGVSAYMGTAIRAHDAGYKTVRGYVAGAGGGLATKVAGGAAHLPPDVSASHESSVKSMSHTYDEMYAAKHPEAVIDFKPSPVPQETIDKNTLVLKDNPYAGTAYGAQIDATREKARSMSSRPVNKTSAGASESKTLRAQRSAKTTSTKGSETQSKTLSKQRSTSSTSRSSGSKQSKKHRH